jgi:hypothetical protein
MSLTASASSLTRSAPRFPAWVRGVRWLRRMAFLLHRWIGIGLALLMLLWTLSGIVMMYVSFPETTREERLGGLQPLDVGVCCKGVPAGPIDKAQVEMFGGRAVLRWTADDTTHLTDLGSGAEVRVGADEARLVAREFMARRFGSTPAMTVEPGGLDQWTVYGQFKAYAPLYKVNIRDAAGTVLYVSGKNGEVVDDTTAHERFWNWLGAVPHWLYFTALRQHAALWSNVVIYASLLGTFLTVTGIYIGIRMYGRGKRKSPFRGIALWHHWTGLIFGLVTLTWVFSGFASMQPWGWLEGDGPGPDKAAIAGRPLTGADAAALAQALAAHPRPGVVSAEAVIQGGKPMAILWHANGQRLLASLPNLTPAKPTVADLTAIARVAGHGAPVASQGLIAEGDAYHYSHHSTPAVLPAWRVIYGDAEHTRVYLDPRTGEVVDYVDAGSRQFRWWHSGLHRLDFHGLDARPIWDVVMWMLLIGVALCCGLGAWMGWRRLRGVRPGHSGKRRANNRSETLAHS